MITLVVAIICLLIILFWKLNNSFRAWKERRTYQYNVRQYKREFAEWERLRHKLFDE